MRLLFLLSILFYSSVVCESPNPELIIWNVGQGLWTTLVSETSCTHIDMGGERVNWSKIIATCRNKVNRSYFSHWDSDHIDFAEKASHVLPNFCVASFPGGPSTPRKAAVFSKFAKCSDQDRKVSEIKFTPIVGRRKATNEFSRIYTARSTLFPGDSTKKEERVWLHGLPLSIRVLILGHHGSRTSSSDYLLRALPNLRLAIASARKSRYGHPHKEVVDRLRSFGVPVLSTEQWNNIVIEEE